MTLIIHQLSLSLERHGKGDDALLQPSVAESDVIILAFSVGNMASFRLVQSLTPDILMARSFPAPVLLLGLGTDLRSIKEHEPGLTSCVSVDEATKFCQSALPKGSMYLEISAEKDDWASIASVFQQTADLAYGAWRRRLALWLGIGIPLLVIFCLAVGMGFSLGFGLRHYNGSTTLQQGHASAHSPILFLFFFLIICIAAIL